jgi:hypothetical protein
VLKDFFKLNPGFKVVKTENDFVDLLKHADSIKDILFEPSVFAPNRPQNRIDSKTFTNVSFAKTELKGIEFRRCTFIDCIFIGTRFDSCEFHDCRFDYCNPYKSSFVNTYINPEVFAKTIDPKKHSNIGVWLFQQLLENSVKCQQPEYAQTAQYLFRKWRRYQYTYEYSQKKIKFWFYVRKWLPSALYDYLAGYGIRIVPFLRLTIILLLTTTAVNYFYWTHFSMNMPISADGYRSWVMSFYYTVITMTTLGYGDITPRSNIGMIAASAEALLGLIWLSLLASIIIKRVIK